MGLFGDDPKLDLISLLTPGQQGLLDQLTKLLGGQMGEGITPYEGQMVAGESGLQKDVFDLLGESGMGMLESALQPFDPESATQYWEKSVKAPMMETWEEDIIPEIMEPFAGMGALSSGGLNRALARSGKELTTGLGATLADILFRAEESHKGRQFGAIPQIMSVLGAGGTQRGIEQERLTEPFTKWQMSQPWASPWLSMLGPALGTRAYEPVVSGGSSGLLDALLPAAGTAAGGWLQGK